MYVATKSQNMEGQATPFLIKGRIFGRNNKILIDNGAKDSFVSTSYCCAIIP